MRQRPSLFILIFAMLAILVPASQAEAQRRGKYEIGDAAPALEITDWFEGDKGSIETGRVSMVVFFDADTFEGSLFIAVLSEVQSIVRDRQLEIIAITSGKKSSVRRLNDSLPDGLQIKVGFDDKDKNKKKWVDNFSPEGNERSWKNSRTHVFMLDDSKIVQYAGPLSSDVWTVTGSMLEGRFDQKAFRQAIPARIARDDARKRKNWRLYDENLEKMLEINPRVFALETIERFEVLMLDRGDTAAAYAYGEQLLEDYADDPGFLLAFAYRIATSKDYSDEQRDVAFAQKLVDAAKERANPNDLAVLDAGARVAYAAGDLREATNLMRRAFRMAPPAVKPYFKRPLDEFTAQLRQARRAESSGG